MFYRQLIAFQTIVYSEIMRFFRIWKESLLPPVVTTALYFIIFGNFIGSHLPQIDGITYTQYIAPGLIMMSVITNSYMNVVSSFYIMRFQKSVEELVVAPIPNYLILTGFVIAGVLRGFVVGILVTIVALFFTKLFIHHIFITFAITLLTSALFSLAGFTNAIFARTFDDIGIVPSFILTPLTYLGGIFYSITQLPYLWQQISKANPILYIINAFRYGILGLSDISVTVAFAIIITSTLALFIYNLYLLNKGVGIRT